MMPVRLSSRTWHLSVFYTFLRVAESETFLLPKFALAPFASS